MKLSSSSDLSHHLFTYLLRSQAPWGNLAKTETARLWHPGGHRAAIQRCRSTRGPYRTTQADSKNNLHAPPPFLHSLLKPPQFSSIKSQQQQQQKRISGHFLILSSWPFHSTGHCGSLRTPLYWPHPHLSHGTILWCASYCSAFFTILLTISSVSCFAIHLFSTWVPRFVPLLFYTP